MPRFTKTMMGITAGVVLSAGLIGSAAAQQNELFPLMQRWGNVEYEMQGDAQQRAFESLVKEVDALAQRYPDNAHVLTAQGVVLASYAKAKGGLGALDLAKQARKALERAIQIDPQGENGSAYVTLGALYQHAPGWPIAFGDDDKAGELLKRAVEIRPDGIDTNFYYAQYLEDQGQHAEARQYAERAVEGQARKGRASDEALRQEVRQWLARHG
ncbi:hypothetical protein QO259_12015 [Salinicola sp. JS01]|uniref:hypothetical protein n=1 Tax=Salinicola sp. JS01 TaxID=3050071 RepID=UPI00255BA337|nr:hypothetical protein [Salinicola sp. JS01]WIX31543.1 hypothetical protein QO259_12015 [Salinicola sp. JS01]